MFATNEMATTITGAGLTVETGGSVRKQAWEMAELMGNDLPNWENSKLEGADGIVRITGVTYYRPEQCDFCTNTIYCA